MHFNRGKVMPNYGTARCDFPGGDARTLYRSVNKVLSLPPATRLYLCHDCQPNGRAGYVALGMVARVALSLSA